ncbi:MAG TPA: hypothetical protein VMX14_05770, partial [Anaerolineae bacterium]|nr:hypothetical protein [Anaerolineae bacterium]
MRRIAMASLILVVLLFVTAPFVVLAQPVSLDKVFVYVVVLNDGRLNVRYTLSFTELESGRDKISEMGPFPQDHTIISSSGKGPDGPFTVSLSGGPQSYQVNFENRTRKGEQYDVTVQYTVDRSVFDETKVEGQPYRAIGWAPFQWSLPIGSQEIQYVLPIELPPGITEAEQVTDEIVDATRLLVEDTS